MLRRRSTRILSWLHASYQVSSRTLRPTESVIDSDVTKASARLPAPETKARVPSASRTSADAPARPLTLEKRQSNIITPVLTDEMASSIRSGETVTTCACTVSWSCRINAASWIRRSSAATGLPVVAMLSVSVRAMSRSNFFVTRSHCSTVTVCPVE